MTSHRQLSWLMLGVLTACASGSDTPGPDPDRSHIIALASQVIDTRLVTAAPASMVGDDHVLVKFPAPATGAQLATLAANAQIYAYLPHDTFLVRPQRGGSAAMAALGATSALGASWTGAYLPEYKI